MLNKLKKLNELPIAAKSSIWFVISNIGLKGISFITAPIFTRILNPSDYGITSVFVSWENIIGIFATLSLAGGVYNNAMLDYENDIDGYTSSMLGLSTLTSSAVYTVCIGINLLFPVLFSISSFYLIYMWLQTLLNATIAFWLMKKRFFYEYKSVIKYSVCNALFSPLLAIIAILLFPNTKAYAKIVGSGLFTIMIGFVLYYKALMRGRKLYYKEYWLYALKFNLPLIPHYLSYVIFGSLDKIIIRNTIGEAETGLYSVAYSLASIVSIVFTSINMSLMPYTLQKMKSESYQSLKKVSTSCIAMVAIICSLVTMFAPELIAILAPRSYAGAINVVPPLICGMFITFIYSFLGNIEFFHKKTKYMSIASIMAAAVNLVLNIVFIPRYGYMVAAYTTLISYLVQMVMHFYFTNKVEKNLRSIFNIKVNSSILILYILFTVLCITMYTMFIVKIIFTCCSIIFIILFRRKIISIYKEMVAGRNEQNE